MHLSDIFETRGRLSRISGNTPLLLSSQKVWYILEGRADLFAVQLENGRISGPKEHFFSAGQGDLLFGMDLDEYGMGQGIQAVGHPGTRLASLEAEEFWDLAGSSDLRESLVERIDGWTDGLSKGLTKDILPVPRPDLTLTADEVDATEADGIACPVGSGIWIQFKAGQGLYISTEEIFPSDTWLPLSRHSWVLMLKGSRIQPLSTRDLLSRRLLRSSLDQFHSVIFQILFLNIGLKAADAFNLMTDKGKLDRRARQNGLYRLASVMDETATGRTATDHEDALLSAAGRVALRLGLTVTEPATRAKGAMPQKCTVADIALASHFSTRKLTLPQGWWQHDLGPMLGFRGKAKKPVALIPVSAGAYELEDPATGDTEAVTAAVAKEITPEAHTFYRPFPDKPLSGPDLLAFGLKGCGKDLIKSLALGAAIGLLSLVVPVTTGLVFNDIIPGAERERIWGIVAILAGFAVSTILFEIARNIHILRIEARLHYALESAMWDRLLRLATPFFRQYQTGDLTGRAMGFYMIRQMVSGPVFTTIVSSLFSLVNLGLLFYYDPFLALAGAGLLLLACLAISGLAWRQLGIIRKMTRLEGRISGKVMQFLNAITKLRVAGAEDNAFSQWATDFARNKKLAFKAGNIRNIMAVFSSSFLLFSLMIIFPLMVMGNTGLKTGDFLAFNAAWANLTAAAVQMITVLAEFITAIPYYERIRPILATPPETDTRKADPGALSGRIELNHIRFRYTPRGPVVLNDVSFRVEPGSFIAIVGPSGSGKSTLVRLMLGFEKAESGTIFYDDHDLSDLDIRQVRQHMGVVVQGGNIMAGDIFTNIVGSRNLSLDHAWEAAARAGLDKDIRDMPMGMHTMIMEGAATLSGGQRQRLMIARAIVHRPRILIFDEATSALDNHTQAVVSDSLKKLKATRIVVAHRLSTVKDADVIHVMDKGKIRESGSYEALMARDGLFRRLARRQIA